MKIIYENVYKKSFSVGLDSIQILLYVGSGYTKGGNYYVRFLIKYCTHHVLKLLSTASFMYYRFSAPLSEKV